MDRIYRADSLFENWNVDFDDEYPESPVCVENAAIIPQWGIYKSGKLEIESALRGMDLHFKDQAKLHTRVSTTLRIDEPFFYLSRGNFNHWGHYITETLGRVHHLLDPKVPTKNVLINAAYPGKFLNPLKALLEEIGYEVMVLQQPGNISVAKVYYSPATMINCYRVKPAHIETLRKYIDMTIGEITPVENDKVYMSRTKMPQHKRWTVGEDKVEEGLREGGWTIIYPEEMTLEQQLAHISGARVLSGCIGSAFHNLMLSPKQPEQIVYLTNREVDTNPNYALHDRILGNDSAYFDCQNCLNRSLGNNEFRDVGGTVEFLNSL